MDSSINLLAFRTVSESNINIVNNHKTLKPKVTEKQSLECGVCMAILYNATSIIPCLHFYCAGCVAKWFAENHNCPNCRSPGTDLMPNRFMRDCVDQYLMIHNDERRCRQELNTLDEYELQFSERWLVELDPVFLSKMHMSTSGELDQSKMLEIQRYHESRYNEVKRRVEKLRFERHLRQGGANTILESIDEHLEKLKKHPAAKNRKMAITHTMFGFINCYSNSHGIRPIGTDPAPPVFDYGQQVHRPQIISARNNVATLRRPPATLSVSASRRQAQVGQRRSSPASQRIPTTRVISIGGGVGGGVTAHATPVSRARLNAARRTARVSRRSPSSAVAAAIVPDGAPAGLRRSSRIAAARAQH